MPPDVPGIVPQPLSLLSKQFFWPQPQIKSFFNPISVSKYIPGYKVPHWPKLPAATQQNSQELISFLFNCKELWKQQYNFFFPAVPSHMEYFWGDLR